MAYRSKGCTGTHSREMARGGMMSMIVAVQSLAGALREAGVAYEILVINDNSSDGTSRFWHIERHRNWSALRQ